METETIKFWRVAVCQLAVVITGEQVSSREVVASPLMHVKAVDVAARASRSSGAIAADPDSCGPQSADRGT